MSKIFGSADNEEQSVDQAPQSASGACACVTNEAIFALDVALIEMSFSVPILQLKESIDPEVPGFTKILHRDPLGQPESYQGL